MVLESLRSAHWLSSVAEMSSGLLFLSAGERDWGIWGTAVMHAL